MKIAIFCATLPPFPCGVGRHTHYLATALAEQGNMVTVVTLKEAKPVGGRYEVDASLAKFGIGEYIQWARRNRKAGYDVVHLQYPTKLNKRGVSVVLLPWILRLFGYRAVLTLHELSEASRLGQIRNMVLAAGFRWVILPNPADRRFLFWHRGIRHVPLGACLPLIDHAETVVPGLVGFLGFLDSSKGEEEAIRAVALCPKDLGIKLIFLSGIDPVHNSHHAWLQRLAGELGVSDMIEWLSQISDETLVRRLSQAEMVVLPFRRGVTSRNSTLLEALTMGKPSIVAVAAESPSYLTDGENCLAVPPCNPQLLAETIQRLHLDTGLRDRFAKKALETAQGFGWSFIAKRTLAVYQE